MSYSRENVMKAKELFALKRTEAEARASERKRELGEKYPEIAAIDQELARTGEKIFGAIREGHEGIDARIASLREENELLRRRRSLLLLAHGYPADYSDLKYDCPHCSDTGYVGIKMCSCMRAELTKLGYESSGLGCLLNEQTFESFSLDYYPPASLERMHYNFRSLKLFAETFGEAEARSWLLFGATGLGKTHLSTAVAKTVLDRGYDVVYETAQNFFSDFEAERFRTYGQEAPSSTARYFSCDLLILDDLGTEMSNQFTVSCLYNILNTRINHKKSTIINTNLTQEELRRKYADRITSRLFGEFRPLAFTGTDIRAQKLK
ncbi:MAG: ATP-binding protein [Clostridia bacterium]|nr:ATP-binding protein [Clostridia bacterium]